MGRKGQAINIDWTVGLALFLLTALTTVLFILETSAGSSEVNSLSSNAYEIQNKLEEEASISGRKIPIITRGPENISNVPVDLDYRFSSDAYPGSGSGNIPADIDIDGNHIITITDVGNTSDHITYFNEEVDEISYSNDILTGERINNSKISLKPGGPGLESLMINDNELLNTEADLGSGAYSIDEYELHAETLSGNLRVFNGSPEIILDDRSNNVTFNLNNLDTLYWHEDGSTTSLTGTGTVKEGQTKGFTIASDYGITFIGDLTATVTKPDSSTVRAEIDAEKLRIRLHNSNYEAGEKRIEFYDKGHIVLGASQTFSAPYKSKIRQLNSISETEFENSLGIGDFNYNIALGSWLQTLISKTSDWNQGEFNATSASRKDNSGNLGLGYRNGSSGDSMVSYWRLDGMNILDNHGFEENELGSSRPSAWKYPEAEGWTVTDSYTAPESQDQKSFGGPWQDGPNVWPYAYVYNDVDVKGGEDYVASSWIRLQSYSDENWDGSRSDQQYIYEDDARLHLYFYDSSGTLLKEEKTRWIGDAYNRGLNYVEKNGDWFKIKKQYTAPEGTEKIRFQIDGGDNNDNYGDPETSHGGNAGIWIDDASLVSTNVRDYSGEGNNDITHNGVSSVPGVFGTNAASFDSSGNRIEQKEAGFSAPVKTVAFWVKNSEESSSWNTVLNWRVRNDAGEQTARTELDGSAERLYTRWITDPSEDGYSTSDGGVWSRSNSFNYTDGEWHYYVSTFDGNTIREYWDGELVTESTDIDSDVAETVSDSPITLHRGGMSPDFDEIQIYTEALSESEIENLYKHGRDGTFNGNYVLGNQTSSFQNWEELKINSDIPEGTNAEVVFESQDIDENTVDSQIIPIKPGKKSYKVDSDSSTGYRITFKGSSNDPEKSWEIENYHLKYGPELNRGTNLPLDTSTVALNRVSSLIDRNGSFSTIENKVILWS